MQGAILQTITHMQLQTIQQKLTKLKNMSINPFVVTPSTNQMQSVYHAFGEISTTQYKAHGTSITATIGSKTKKHNSNLENTLQNKKLFIFFLKKHINDHKSDKLGATWLLYAMDTLKRYISSFLMEWDGETCQDAIKGLCV